MINFQCMYPQMKFQNVQGALGLNRDASAMVALRPKGFLDQPFSKCTYRCARTGVHIQVYTHASAHTRTHVSTGSFCCCCFSL